jgi:hypothetical protein
MGDDGDRLDVPVSHWMRRSTPDEDRERVESRTRVFLVQFYAVIPLMIVAAFLPAGPLRGMWIALVILGFGVWGVRRGIRAPRKGTAIDAARAGSAEHGEDGPPTRDPGE